MAEIILVAGRGPMAARAIRSCQLAGAKAVAVYSEADSDSQHVRLADESVLIGASDPESSYLDDASLVEAAQVSGAEAVLPVHAILAGSPELARAIQDAGRLWVGPEPDVLLAAREREWASEPPVAGDSPGWLIGLADDFRIDGLIVRRTTAAGATLWWTSAEEPVALAVDGLPSAARLLADLSDVVVGLGWRGMVSVTFAADGAPIAIRGGIPRELGMVELRTGRDLIQAAIALAAGESPPSGSPGAPAAVGGAVRATAVPGEGQRAVLAEVIGPGGGVQWEPGYAPGDPLWPWYDPILGIIGVPGRDVAAAAAAFLDATAVVSTAPIPNDLDQLRERTADIAARLRDGMS